VRPKREYRRILGASNMSLFGVPGPESRVHDVSEHHPPRGVGGSSGSLKTLVSRGEKHKNVGQKPIRRPF